jgi:threonine/homoserine/homoserine lactone efflux protein
LSIALIQGKHQAGDERQDVRSQQIRIFIVEYIARAAYLGLVATILPGPQQAFAINTALARGWRKSLVIAIAPFIADLPVMLVFLFVLRQVPAPVISVIQIMGGGFILYLALLAYRDYRQGSSIGGSGQTEEAVPVHLLRRAVLMNLSGPGPYIFWSSIHGPAVIQASQQSLWLGLAYICAFYGTFFTGIVVFLIIFDRVGQLNTRITRTLIFVTIIALAFFGLRLIAQGFGWLPG